ncbi:MAG TPA: hypothetical protein VGN12_06040 [Pirellulales bacterium]|jgi:hypothetical protein
MEKKSEQPAFTAPLYATLRQGDKELAQTLPATKESIQVVEEPGTIANPTQQMVTEQSRSPDGFHHVIDQYSSRSREQNEPEQGMER